MRVPQFRQLQWVVLPVQNGIHHGQAGHPGDVADYVMDLHIHLRQGFGHVLNMLAGHLHQIAAVPHQRPYRAYLTVRSKCRAPQSHRMQTLQPLAFVPIGAPPRYVFHATSVHHAGLHPVLLQHIAGRNPVHPRALHGCRGDATTHQPLRHFLQIFGEGCEYPHRMLIAVRWHGYKDFPRTDINTCCVCFQYGSAFQAHPFPSSASFAFARRDLFAGLFGILLLLGHAFYPLGSGRGQVAQIRYSPNWNQPGVLTQAVTTVWRTELGTTLLNGFNSTTDRSAYFHYLCSYEPATTATSPPSSFPVW